jgi:hypothetical protein
MALETFPRREALAGQDGLLSKSWLRWFTKLRAAAALGEDAATQLALLQRPQPPNQSADDSGLLPIVTPPSPPGTQQPEQQYEKFTFGIGRGGPAAVGNDLEGHLMLKFGGRLVEVTGNAKMPGITLPLYIDLPISTDQGDNWNSIFLTGGVADAHKLVIPANNTKEHAQRTFAPTRLMLPPRVWMRIDLLPGSAEDAEYIEVTGYCIVPSGGVS